LEDGKAMTLWSTARLAGMMLTVGFAGLFGSGESRAVGLCDCCAASPTPSCEAVCKTVTLAPQQCPVVVDFDGTGDTVNGRNPLNGRSLKVIHLGEPRRSQLEDFRRFLETWRRETVWAYVKALKAFRRQKITQEELDAAKALNDEALVNYYHGMRAYLNSVGTKSD
jgi:hypothetical protein